MVQGTYRYQSQQEPWTELRMRIRGIAQSRVRCGCRKIRVLLNREGWDMGKYLLYRLYKEEGLALKKHHNARGKQYGIGKSASLPQHPIKHGALILWPISCRVGRASRR